MHIALVQLDIENLQPMENRARVRQLIQDAFLPDRTMVVLPELFSTGMLPEAFDFEAMMEIGHQDIEFMGELAREASIYLLGSALGFEGTRLVNTSLLFDPGGTLLGEYRKIHPFSLGGEDRIFQSGENIVTWEVEGFALQPTICYDLRFPELYRAGMKRGATMMTVQANWPEARQAHWETLLRARAIENQACVIGVNCVGIQQGLRYGGGSKILSPKGEIVAEAGNEEGILIADFSSSSIESWRRTFPALRDRKPDGFWT